MPVRLLENFIFTAQRVQMRNICGEPSDASNAAHFAVCYHPGKPPSCFQFSIKFFWI